MINLTKLLNVFYNTKLKEYHLILMAFGLALGITLLGFLNDYLNTSHRTEIDRLQGANQSLSYAHLWLDDYLNSEIRTLNKTNQTELNFIEAKNEIQLILSYREFPNLIKLVNNKQVKQLNQILNHIERLGADTEICINEYAKSNLIPSIYENHDMEFNALKQEIESAHKSLFIKLKNESTVVRSIQYTLLFILLIHVILTILVIRNFRKQILEREQHLIEAQKIALLGFYSFNFKTNQWLVSESIEKLMGKVAKENFLHSWFEIIHPDDKQLVINTFKNLDNPIDIIYRVISNSEDKIHWIHHISQSIKKDINGKNLSVLGIIQDITEKRKLERDFIHAFIDAQEQEKISFGEDLHDGISQILSAESMYIEVLNKLNKSDDKRITEALDKIRALNLDAINDARGIAHGLMSKQLKENGLIMAINHICNDYNQSRKIKFNFIADDLIEDEISKEIKINLFRIAQEISTNIVRHSGAKNSKITLAKTKLNQLQLIIKDDGVGIDLEKMKREHKGAGLKNIERRVSLLNGKLNLETAPNQGTCYTIVVPLANL